MSELNTCVTGLVQTQSISHDVVTNAHDYLGYIDASYDPRTSEAGAGLAIYQTHPFGIIKEWSRKLGVVSSPDHAEVLAFRAIIEYILTRPDYFRGKRMRVLCDNLEVVCFFRHERYRLDPAKRRWLSNETIQAVHATRTLYPALQELGIFVRIDHINRAGNAFADRLGRKAIGKGERVHQRHINGLFKIQ